MNPLFYGNFSLQKESVNFMVLAPGLHFLAQRRFFVTSSDPVLFHLSAAASPPLSTFFFLQVEQASLSQWMNEIN